LRCNQVTQAHIQAYFDHCVVKLKVANSTHNTRKNNLRSLFSELVTRGYFPFNYVSKVPERPAGDPLRRPLSPEEKAIVARHIFQNDKALALAFLLLGYLAVRPGEIRGLRVGAIDLKRGVVRFPGADSKNNRDSVVTIPSELIPHFERLKLDQYPQSYYLFGRAKGRYNVQLEPRPERIGVNTLSARFRTIVRTLHQQGQLHNIKGIQFYSLKDSLAIYLLDMGVDVESAMRHFRHRDLSVFQRYVKRLGVVNEKIRGLEIDLDLGK
jgi:integrase